MLTKLVLNNSINRNYLFPNNRHWNNEKLILINGIIVKNRFQSIKKDYRCEYKIGFDSETYQGKCKLLVDSNERYILNPSFLDCLDFLYYKYSKSNGYRFFFNIDFDITAILKLLPESYLDLIDDLSKGKTVQYANYEMKWIRSKLFFLKNLDKSSKKGSLTFTDLYTFFHMGLDKIGKKYLGESKLDIINAKKLNTSLKYWNKNLDNIIKYCIQDCKLTENIAHYLINDVVIDSINCLPRHLVSPASMAKHYFRLNCQLPCQKDTPKKILNISYFTYRGGRFELLKRGYFPKAFHFDINSDYPKIESELPHLADGVWKIEKNLKNISDKENIGFYDVIIDIPSTELISTIPFLDGTIKYPTGKFWSWFTWYDLILMKKYIKKIRRAYIFNPKENCRYPLKEPIENLYEYKAKYKNSNEAKYKGGKLTMNSEYGCYIEVNESFDKNDNKIKTSGIQFNPVYATIITSKARYLLFKDIPRKLYSELIGFHTDSLDSQIDLSKYLKISNKLGDWNLEGNGEAIYLNTGMYQINDKKETIFKSRGIPHNFIKDWFIFLDKYKTLKEKEFTINHMLKIREAIMHNKKYDFSMVNTMQEIKRTVSIDNDNKRSWNGSFKNFGDILTRNISSFPLFHDFNSRVLLDIGEMI